MKTTAFLSDYSVQEILKRWQSNHKMGSVLSPASQNGQIAQSFPVFFVCLICVVLCLSRRL